MRLSHGIAIAAVGILSMAVVTEDSAGFGRGGGGGGGGGAGRGGGGGGARPAPAARPAPSFHPPPAARPAPPPGGGGGSVVGPHNGGNISRPTGGGASQFGQGGGGVNIGNNGVISKGGAGNRPAERPGQGGAGTQWPQAGTRPAERPGQGGSGTQWRPDQGGVVHPGGGDRPNINTGNIGKGGNVINNGPHDNGLANIARNQNIGNRTNVGNRVGNNYINNGTINVNRTNLVNNGNAVRDNFGHYNCFRPNWWNQYPNYWRAAGWTTAAAVWATTSWALLSNYCSYPAQPVYYDYGSSVVYEGDQVYVNGDPVATQDQYAQQAQTIADTGRTAQAPQQDEWKSLGVFGMVQGNETNANTLFQLAVNKAGVMRGNYYDALSDTTMPVYGQVDPKTQRAAWTVGDKKNVVYEAGIANLTQDQTTMLVHFGKDRTQQWNLVRMQDQGDQK